MPLEYSDLDVNVAAEIVVRAQAIQHGTGLNQYPPTQTFGAAQLPPQQLQKPSLPALGGQSTVANLLSTLDGAALQSLLGALQHNPTVIQAAQHHYSSSNSNPADLASLLGNAARQNNQLQAIPATSQHSVPGPVYGLQMPNPSFMNEPNLASILAKGLERHPQAQQQLGPHVKNIMDTWMKGY